MNSLITLPSHLSYSSLSTYAECGELWRLTRGLKLGDNFAWWANVGGSAVHELTEFHDRRRMGEPVDIPEFAEVFGRLEQEYRDAGVELRASGSYRVEMQWTGGPNKKDREWWMIYGPLMVDAYLAWLETNDWDLVGIEVPFDVVIDGESRVGHIDRVFVTPDGQVVIIDLKTGKKVASKLQLGTYRAGYLAKTGLEADWGYYLQFNAKKVKTEAPAVDEDGAPVLYVRGAKKGEPKMVTVETEQEVYAYLAGDTDFETYSARYVERQYQMMRQGLEAGIFIPNTRNCGTCPVQDYCRAVDGRKSKIVPVESVIVGRSQIEDGNPRVAGVLSD